MVWATVNREQKATTSKGVSGRMENTKFDASKGVRLLCIEWMVCHRGFWQVEAVSTPRCLCESLQKRVILEKEPRNTVVLTKDGYETAVIKMGVCVDECYDPTRGRFCSSAMACVSGPVVQLALALRSDLSNR